MKVEETHLDVLQNIEFVIANEYRRNESIKDHNVLEVIEALIRQYAAEQRRQKHFPSMHLSPFSQAVFESVKEMCELRLGRLESGPAEFSGGQPLGLEDLLACLKRIRSSIHFWTKRDGSRGYLNYMTPMVLAEIGNR